MRYSIWKMLTLSMFLILFIQTVVSADEGPLVRTLRGSGYVTVVGTVQENAGSEAVLLLVKNEANSQMPKSEDIGYIAQSKIDDDGKYIFEFIFDALDYGIENNLNDYSAFVSIDGALYNESIEEATFTQFTEIEINLSRIGQAIAVIDSEYKFKGLPYTMMLSFYSGDGKLLKVDIEEMYTGESNTINYLYNDIPEGTKTVKAFVWEKFNKMVPVSKVKSKQKTEQIKILMIGNSLSQNTSQYMHDIAAADLVDLQLTTLYVGGKNCLTIGNICPARARKKKGSIINYKTEQRFLESIR